METISYKLRQNWRSAFKKENREQETEKNIKNSQNQNYDTIEVQAEEIDERDRYK